MEHNCSKLVVIDFIIAAGTNRQIIVYYYN